MLDRRAFLWQSGGGLGGIALAALLNGEGLLAAEPNPQRSLRPRPPHFEAKAKRILHIFCSGACSHLDTWDHKPELIKRHGQALPDADKVVTFQGAQGNLTKSPYAFRPRGQSGK